jgi:hypothetical protein
VAGRDISVDTATSHGLECPGIESRCGRDFPQPPDRLWGPPSFLYDGYWVSFLRVMRSGRGVDHPPLFSAEVKERIQLYL